MTPTLAGAMPLPQAIDGIASARTAALLDPEGEALAKCLAGLAGPTAHAIAAANGHRPSDAFMRGWEQTFAQRDSTYSTSMLRDIERGGQTEVEHVLGFMLKKAREADIPCHTLLLAYTHIKAFEERRAAGRLG